MDSNYYECYTGLVTLTNAVETGIIYIAPAVTDKVTVVDKVFLDVWASTNGTGGGIIRYYKNPTVTGGTAIIPVNTNFASMNDMAGTFLKSLTTMTGGTPWWYGWFGAGSSVVVDEEKFCIPYGYGFGISIQAPTGNTSMGLNINIATYTIDTSLLE